MTMVNPKSAFNMWENDTKNSKVVARILSMKVHQEDWFLSQTRCLKTKLTRSFSVIMRYCVPPECAIWYCSEYHHKKTEISKNMPSMDTTYANCWTTCCTSCCLQKESRMLSKRVNGSTKIGHALQKQGQKSIFLGASFYTSKFWLCEWNHPFFGIYGFLYQSFDVNVIDRLEPALFLMQNQILSTFTLCLLCYQFSILSKNKQL